MAAQHVHRDGNQWGVTVPELIEKAVAEGRPVRLQWTGKTTWDWPGDEFPTVEMPAITADVRSDTGWFDTEQGEQL